MAGVGRQDDHDGHNDDDKYIRSQDILAVCFVIFWRLLAVLVCGFHWQTSGRSGAVVAAFVAAAASRKRPERGAARGVIKRAAVGPAEEFGRLCEII